MFSDPNPRIWTVAEWILQYARDSLRSEIKLLIQQEIRSLRDAVPCVRLPEKESTYAGFL